MERLGRCCLFPLTFFEEPIEFRGLGWVSPCAIGEIRALRGGTGVPHKSLLTNPKPSPGKRFAASPWISSPTRQNSSRTSRFKRRAARDVMSTLRPVSHGDADLRDPVPVKKGKWSKPGPERQVSCEKDGTCNFILTLIFARCGLSHFFWPTGPFGPGWKQIGRFLGKWSWQLLQALFCVDGPQLACHADDDADCPTWTILLH